ncbi:MAG TPA: hypothetical protein VGP82_09030 [Ktedonobacterales bacterium]|nr:hypothetical protein [Ktedonobacterales bacterium]
MQEITQPLSALPAVVKAIRLQSQPARLVLRNTGRVGLVHLYFARGVLVHVEGHRGPGAESLADVATWESGVIRSDALPEPPAALPGEQLEATLATVLHRLEVRGITERSEPSRPLLPRVSVTMPPRPQPGDQRRTSAFSHVSTPSAVPGLPPLPPSEDTIIMPSPAASPRALTDPQWQLLSLAVHEVVERATRDMQRTVAEGLLTQTLVALATQRRFLAQLEVDTTGWLRAGNEAAVAAFEASEVVEAVAALLAEFERRCAVIVGVVRARQILVEGCLPFRAPLAQIGLDVATA